MIALPVKITEAKGIKRATGLVRQGEIIITVPRHWSRAAKQEAIDYLVNILKRKEAKEQALLQHMDETAMLWEAQGQDFLITLDDPASLDRYVRQLNADTFNVPLKKVRIGEAKFSRLAQMNIKTRTMTVSKYCLKGVPEPALRYLIIHELAHLIEANHSQRFWRLVGQYVSDYRRQSDIIKAFHKRAVDLAILEAEPVSNPLTNSSTREPSSQRRAKSRPETSPPPAPIPRLSPLEPLPSPPPEPRRWWQLKLF